MIFENNLPPTVVISTPFGNLYILALIKAKGYLNGIKNLETKFSNGNFQPLSFDMIKKIYFWRLLAKRPEMVFFY